jgi:hypothetical protein
MSPALIKLWWVETIEAPALIGVRTFVERRQGSFFWRIPGACNLQTLPTWTCRHVGRQEAEKRDGAKPFILKRSSLDVRRDLCALLVR